MGTLSDPLQTAQALRTTIRATRQEMEETRRLAPQVVAALIDTGLCRLTLPANLGGHEAEPLVTLKVYEELAWADASVAVVALNNHLPCLTSRFFPARVRTLLFGNVRHLFANSTRPSGQASVVEGGYRVAGRWSLVSGCELADWILLMCVITPGTGPSLPREGAPAMRLMFVPKGSYRIYEESTFLLSGSGHSCSTCARRETKERTQCRFSTFNCWANFGFCMVTRS